MNQRQTQNTHQVGSEIQKSFEKYRFLQSKFQNYLESLSSQSIEESTLTKSNKYEKVIESYVSRQSLVDKIVSSFENTHYDYLFGEQDNRAVCCSQIFAAMKPKVKKKIGDINNFFFGNRQANQMVNQHTILDLDHYALILSALGVEKEQILEEVELKKFKKQREVSEISEIKADTAKIQEIALINRIDMLSRQIENQKKRKNFYLDYYETMELKLHEFLSAVLGTEEKYQGRDLTAKIKLITENIHSYKDQQVDGYPKLELLHRFFKEFKDLQVQKKANLQSKIVKKSSKNEMIKRKYISSMIGDKKSQQSSKNSKKSEQYSAPNSKRSKKSSILNEQDWIGNEVSLKSKLI